MIGALPLPRLGSWTDARFGRNRSAAIADVEGHRFLLAPIITPPMDEARGSRPEPAVEAWADSALRTVGRIAGPASITVLTIIITVALITPRAVAQ